jgi:hypothetical protein
MQDINYLLSNKETAHAQTCQITTLKRIHILEQFLYMFDTFSFLSHNIQTRTKGISDSF